MARRWGIGLLGGVLLGFGARMADGCTSGHTLSGAAQLALSGWVATMGFFIGGITLALLIYGRRSYRWDHIPGAKEHGGPPLSGRRCGPDVSGMRRIGK
jgi:uncharacterized membrane protein YedE/YeeE